MPSIQQDAIGKPITFQIRTGDTGDDISTATTKEIVFNHPDSDTRKVVTATFVDSGDYGKLTYSTVGGEFTKSGAWEGQAEADDSTSFWKSEVHPFTVKPNLKRP